MNEGIKPKNFCLGVLYEIYALSTQSLQIFSSLPYAQANKRHKGQWSGRGQEAQEAEGEPAVTAAAAHDGSPEAVRDHPQWESEVLDQGVAEGDPGGGLFLVMKLFSYS